MASFPERLLRASLLHADTYEEVEADAGAGRQALAVVLLSSAAVGIGGIANSGAEGILVQIVCAVVGWWAWAYATYFIGTRLLPTPETSADPGQLLRTMGFAGAPGIVRLLMLVPALAFPVWVVGTLWELVAMVVAVRQALDYTSTLRAIVVAAIGFPVYAITLLASVLYLGPWPL
jgi:hypothetical protein